MRYALVNDGIVQTIIVAEQAFVDSLQGYEQKVSLQNTDRVEINYTYDGNTFSPPVDPNFTYNLVFNKINQYREVAPKLLTEIYTQNTLAGLTTVQSDQMFDDFADVLTRVKEGAFPTAVYRLSQKAPSGFVTQELLDTWIEKIKSYL